MEKLRENYKTGERFYAQDMNKMTHAINELGDRIKIVYQLPREGEDGVIYAVPKDGGVMYSNLIIENESGHNFIGPFGESDANTAITYEVGDVIQIPDGTEISGGTIFVTEVDQENLACVIDLEEELEYLTGVTSYFEPIAGHRYKITGIYEAQIEGLYLYQLYYKYNVFTFEDVTDTTRNFDYTYETLPSIQVFSKEPSVFTGHFPVVNYEGGFYILSEEITVIPPFKKLSVGTVIKATSDNRVTIHGEGIFGVVISDVDDDIFMLEGEGFSGITGYIAWQKDHCYRIKDMRRIDGLTFYLYEEVTEPSKVDYEQAILPSIYFVEGDIKQDDYNEYYWNDCAYEQIGGGGEGHDTEVVGEYAHAEGKSTQALGDYSHAEGWNTVASGESTHSEGKYTTAYTIYSHAEGVYTKALGNASHSEGSGTTASGVCSHAEGYLTTAYTGYTHAEGYETQALGLASHAEGSETQALGKHSHAEGRLTKALQEDSHAEGCATKALGITSHVEGSNTIASGDCSHAEGNFTTAYTSYTHAEGSYTIALSLASHSEGSGTTASGICSHSEGFGTTARGICSHAEGRGTTAYTGYTHAEGSNTQALGLASHAEGSGTTASGECSHAEGKETTASGYCSHTEGGLTVATNLGEHAEGMLNVSHYSTNDYGSSGNTQHSIGIGLLFSSERKNAVEVMQNGDVYINGIGGYTGTSIDGVSTLQSAIVTSSFIDSIWKGSQQDYDLIVDKDPRVLYIII